MLSDGVRDHTQRARGSTANASSAFLRTAHAELREKRANPRTNRGPRMRAIDASMDNSLLLRRCANFC